MMDGVSTMDTGSNRPLLQMNVESIAEVKVLTSGYQAEYGRVERPAGHRRHQERHQPLPRLALRRRAQLRLEREQQDQQAQRRSQDDPEASGTGAIRSAARSASRAATTSCSSSTPRSSRRAPPATTSCATACPTALERAGDFSQTTDNNGNLVSRTSRIRASTGVCYGQRIRRPASATAACSAGSRQDRLYQTGPEHPEAVSAAEHRQRRRRAQQLQLRDHPAGGEHAVVRSRRSASTISRSQTLRVTFKYSGWMQREQIVHRHDPRLQRHADAGRARRELHGVGQLHADARRCSSRRPTATARTSWPAARRRSRRPAPIFCNNAAGTPGRPDDRRSRACAGAGPAGSAVPVPGRDRARSGLLRRQGAERDRSPAFWDGSAAAASCRPSSGAAASPNAAADASASPAGSTSTRRNDFAISLTKVTRPPHAQDRLLQHAQLQGRADRQPRVRHDQLPAGRRRHQPVRHLVRVRQRGDRHLQLVPAGAEVRRGRVGLQQPRGLRPGQLEGDQPADARLRRALRAPGPQYDKLGQASNFLPDQWSLAQAPLLYVAGCASARRRAPAPTAQAMNPLTGQFLGPNTTVAIGTLVPDTGDQLNGLVPARRGHRRRRPTCAALGVGAAVRHRLRPDRQAEARPPRRRRAVLRSAVHDRTLRRRQQSADLAPPSPCVRAAADARRGGLTHAGRAGTDGVQLRHQAAGVVAVEQRHPDGAAVGDGARRRRTSASTATTCFSSVNINAIDFGAAFLPQNQDPTQTQHDAGRGRRRRTT